MPDNREFISVVEAVTRTASSLGISEELAVKALDDHVESIFGEGLGYGLRPGLRKVTELDRPGFEAWLATVAGTEATNASKEDKAITDLALRFRKNRNMRRSDAIRYARSFDVTGRAFERVWVAARLKAGLDAKARAGRPAKSPHPPAEISKKKPSKAKR